MAVIQQEKFPWGPMDAQNVVDSATPSATIQNSKTKLNMPVLQAMVLSLLAAQDLQAGAEVQVEIVQTATPRNITFGAALSTIKAPALVGTASKTERITLTWDGTQFTANSAWVSI